MDIFKKENEQFLIDYLKETQRICPELLDYIYPVTLLGLDFKAVFDSLIDIYEEDYTFDHMDINNTIKLVREFLKSLDEEYLLNFDKALIDGTFDIFHIDNLNETLDRINEPTFIEEQDHSSINNPIKYLVSDGGEIIHEFFHYTNFGSIGVRNLFTELISIYMGIRYYQFLNLKGYSIDNYFKELNNRMKNNLVAANNIFYLGSILDIYYNTGEVTKESIEFVDKSRDLYSEYACDLLEFINDEEFKEEVYYFDQIVSYLLGGIIAIDLVNEPKINDVKIKYINKNLDKLSIREILNILDIDLNKYDKLVDFCKEVFIVAEDELNEKNNSYSRTYRSR